MLRTLSVASFLLLCCGGCDNVGRAFDPVLDPPAQGPTTGESPIQVVPVGGDVREGRPRIRTVAPADGGWPSTVPIVVEFSESVNEASIEPTTPTGVDGRIALRVQGTAQVLPCLYDFLAGGKVLVMRPVTPLSDEQFPTYEVVLFPDARDTDGVRFDVEGEEEVLTSFQVNQTTSITDGRVLATFPRDNKADVEREADYVVVFDRPANIASIDPTTNFVLGRGGVAVTGVVEVPLKAVGQDDGRVVRFVPDAPLEPDSHYTFEVDDTITFGSSGNLDYFGRSPYAEFDTIGPRAALAVTLDNPVAGYPEAINRQNLVGARLRVSAPDDARVGDLVLARIYGLDRRTSAAGDLAYVEATADLPSAGTQDVVIDFGGTLGTAEDPLFEDGSVTFAVQLRRGSEQAGFVQHDAAADPRFDVTAPELVELGPPAAATGFDVYTDLEHIALHGTASEPLGAAELTDGVNPAAGLFASDDEGFFVMKPVPLGRLTAPRSYVLTITDRAGNLVAAPIAGDIVQRGQVSGAVSGTLVVEAYDHATLQPVVGATVLVDPGMPASPAAGRLVAVTGTDGLATFTGLGTSRHSVTVVAPGFDLVSLLDTPAARVSLPLRPLAATASFGGTAVMAPTGGTTILVGNSAFDESQLLAVATSTSSPTVIPSTPITPGRPQVVTAFGGSFEPTAEPAFASHTYGMLGVDLTTALPPLPPADPGGSTETTLALVPTAGLTANIALTNEKDLALAAGLDLANLVGGAPIVRVMASLNGFGGQALAGVGYATPSTATAYVIRGTYGLPMLSGFSPFGPQLWLATEARDTGGRVSRHRALWLAAFGLMYDLLEAPSIPVLTPPAGPFAGSPSVTFVDVVQAAAVPGGVGLHEVVAQDAAGRRWRVLLPDEDAAGGTETVQLPDLAGVGVPGLDAGDWSVRVEARLLASLTGATVGELVLSERLRQEVTYARSSSETFTVQ